MTKKYSEEEYNKIIEAFQGKIIFAKVTDEVIEIVTGMRGLVSTEEIQQAISFALPVSREWAHDKFVEKEKKYIWELKSKHEVYRYLTESEMLEEGYNPEMFDKREAKC